MMTIKEIVELQRLIAEYYKPKKFDAWDWLKYYFAVLAGREM